MKVESERELLDEMRTELYDLREAYEKSRDDLHDKENELHIMKAELEDLRTECEDLREEVDDLYGDLATKRRVLDKYFQEETYVQECCDMIYTILLEVKDKSSFSEKSFNDIVHVMRKLTQTYYYDSRESSNLGFKSFT